MKRVAVTILLGGLSVLLDAQPRAASEYELKAAFLLNFSRFVEWPADAKTHESFVIGIAGNDPFGVWLEHMVSKQTIRGVKADVRRFASPKEINDCHVLFVSSPDEESTGLILDAVRDRPVLTVGESARFRDLGGMITFVNEGNRIRFDVNSEAAKRSGLTISSKLLHLARNK